MIKTKTFFLLSLIVPVLTLSGCFSESVDNDDKYTCWVVDKNIKTCDPAKISELKDLNVVMKKAGSFCKSRALFSTAHKSLVESRGVSTSEFLRSTDYRCVWGEERFDYSFNDGCKVAGSIKRSGNKRMTKIDFKSCDAIESWDKKEMVLYGIVDESFAKRTCVPFIKKIPTTQVDKIEILPVDMIGCEPFLPNTEMLAAYNKLIQYDRPARRELWRSICQQYPKNAGGCDPN
jgi:hypothetical protein